MLKTLKFPALALGLALALCAGPRTLAADATPPANPVDTQPSADKEQSKPGAATLEELGAGLCKAGATADVDGLLNLMSPPMVDQLRDMAELAKDEDAKDPWADMKAQIKKEMEADPLEVCTVGKVSDAECLTDDANQIADMGYTLQGCGEISMTMKMKSAEKQEEQTMRAMFIGERWYIADGM